MRRMREPLFSGQGYSPAINNVLMGAPDSCSVPAASVVGRVPHVAAAREIVADTIGAPDRSRRPLRT